MLALALLLGVAAAQQPVPGGFTLAGSTGVSAMMAFLGNEQKVYILDKSENNPININGHPAWGAVWDINTHKTTILDVYSNTFCAGGMHMPNGSYATFGGNHGVMPGPNGTPQDFGDSSYDPNRGVAPVYGAGDGRKAIRLLTPCTGDSDNFAPQCQWYEDRFNPNLLMDTERWYPGTEPLGDGTIVLFGGMVNGGYINRYLVVTNDPVTWHNTASNSYELWPKIAGGTNQTVDFLVNAGGLNLYSHMYLMPSGKMFVQANVSTMLWDVATNTEFPLPDMPNGVVRVYPASGATAMLPLTPDNGYNPTILFCGGSNAFTDEQWGDLLGPAADAFNWLQVASTDCQRITPEPTDGSAVAYVADDPLPIPRTMGQSILLPDETVLIINGGANGTAAYDTSGTPFGQSLATAEVLTPVIYTPNAPAGQRFSSEGLQASTIPRLYHSVALLLPDASVWVAGSNPSADYCGDCVYPTETRIEIFYPPYFNGTRPVPESMPSTLSYGGPYFNITLNSTVGYQGSAASAAASARVVVARGAFTTHAMNMGQRLMRLNSTYTLETNGDITLHVSQPPPNANLLQPGPALLFVVVDGVPSMGSMIIVGSGDFGTQPLQAIAALPTSGNAPTPSAGSGKGSGSGNSGGSHSGVLSSLSPGARVGVFAGVGVAVAALLAFGVWSLVSARRRRASAAAYDYTPTREAFAPRGAVDDFTPGVLGPDYGAYPHPRAVSGYSDNSAAQLMPPRPGFASRPDSSTPSGYTSPYDESMNPSMEQLHPMQHS